MSEYINFNSMKRKESNNEFDTNLNKLMCNAVYGKTCENLRKRKNYSIINSIQKVNKFFRKPNYKNHICISENLVITTEKQKEIYS